MGSNFSCFDGSQESEGAVLEAHLRVETKQALPKGDSESQKTNAFAPEASEASVPNGHSDQSWILRHHTPHGKQWTVKAWWEKAVTKETGITTATNLESTLNDYGHLLNAFQGLSLLKSDLDLKTAHDMILEGEIVSFTIPLEHGRPDTFAPARMNLSFIMAGLLDQSLAGEDDCGSIIHGGLAICWDASAAVGIWTARDLSQDQFEKIQAKMKAFYLTSRLEITVRREKSWEFFSREKMTRQEFERIR